MIVSHPDFEPDTRRLAAARAAPGTKTPAAAVGMQAAAAAPAAPNRPHPRQEGSARPSDYSVHDRQSRGRLDVGVGVEGRLPTRPAGYCRGGTSARGRAGAGLRAAGAAWAQHNIPV